MGNARLRLWFGLPLAMFLAVSTGGALLTLLDGPFDSQKLEALSAWLGALCTVGAICAAFYQLAEQRTHEAEARIASEERAEQANLQSLRLTVTTVPTGRHLPGRTEEHASSEGVRFDVVVRHLGPSPVLDVALDLSFSHRVLTIEEDGEATDGVEDGVDDDDLGPGSRLMVALGDLMPAESTTASLVVGYLVPSTVEIAAFARSVSGRTRRWQVTPS